MEREILSLWDKERFKSLIKGCISEERKNLFVCIGTPRCVFDSVGPYVGYMLKRHNLRVVGTINQPLHRLTYPIFYNKFRKYINDYNIIAIDAALATKYENIYKIIVKAGGVTPAAGIDEPLPEIGNYSILAAFPRNVISPFSEFSINIYKFAEDSKKFIWVNIVEALNELRSDGVNII